MTTQTDIARKALSDAYLQQLKEREAMRDTAGNPVWSSSVLRADIPKLLAEIDRLKQEATAQTVLAEGGLVEQVEDALNGCVEQMFKDCWCDTLTTDKACPKCEAKAKARTALAALKQHNQPGRTK